jgi:hypothetical protein
MRKVLYRPSWQALRVSMLGEYEAAGGWNTFTGAGNNVKRLKHYVIFSDFAYEAHTMGYAWEFEKSIRLYRVINCLNAVRMGYSGQGLQGSNVDKLVRQTRDDFQAMQTTMYYKHIELAVQNWKDSIIKAELEVLRKQDPQHFFAVEKNLKSRLVNARKRPSTTVRPELESFLKMMREVK